jgi:putative ABC transport system substrate-binding protein
MERRRSVGGRYEETIMWYSAVGCIVTLALSMLVAPLAAVAQPPAKVPRIGWLLGTDPSAALYLLDAFRQGLRELGWVEGQNIAIESRYAEGKLDRFSDLAAELVRLKVDVILTSSPYSTRAAKHATTTIPIVMMGSGDPVGSGLVASLARPGGNITGISAQYTDLILKWLELLKEAVPQASRVGVLTMLPSSSSVQSESWEALQQAAKTMRVTLKREEVREPSEFESAFAVMTQEHFEALIMLPNPLLFVHRTRLVALAAESQLPTIWGPFREFVDTGGLMAYGPSLRDQFRRTAYFVDKILKGAKPADLPVEQPMKFELIINLTTAKALGLTMPPTLLFQATEVIQ